MGKEHPILANRLNNLALFLKAINRNNEAEPMMRRALSINETSFGSEHPTVAIQYNDLAMLRNDTNRIDEAVPMMSKALAKFCTI